MEEVEGTGRVREAVFAKAEGKVCHAGGGGWIWGQEDRRHPEGSDCIH